MIKNPSYPRVSVLKSFFDDVSAGKRGRPIKECITDSKVIKSDEELNRFGEVHRKTQGIFTKHYYASIPYRLEEDIRVGVAITRYLKKYNRTCRLYSVGTADATLARTIGTIGNGHITTFSCTPTRENVKEFYKNGIPQYSYLHIAPFYEITQEILKDNYRIVEKFDFIYEDTTFQMYSKDRYEQILHLKNHLKAEGIIGFVEKFALEDKKEYLKREYQKDNLFKRKYFLKEDIEDKKEEVLGYMNNGQVTLEEFEKSLSKLFKYAIAIWNSGSFYSIYASNSKDNLLTFLNEMGSPIIPSSFVYEDMPKILVGFDSKDIEEIRWDN